MRFELGPAHFLETHPLASLQPGDEITIRAFVNSVAVEAIDVTALGKPPEIIEGQRTITLTLEEVFKK